MSHGKRDAGHLAESDPVFEVREKYNRKDLSHPPPSCNGKWGVEEVSHGLLLDINWYDMMKRTKTSLRHYGGAEEEV